MVPVACASRKKLSNTSELKLAAVVNHHIDGADQTLLSLEGWSVLLTLERFLISCLLKKITAIL